jgi:hypothetical protein
MRVLPGGALAAMLGAKASQVQTWKAVDSGGGRFSDRRGRGGGGEWATMLTVSLGRRRRTRGVGGPVVPPTGSTSRCDARPTEDKLVPT